jgi:hypothetical protein
MRLERLMVATCLVAFAAAGLYGARLGWGVDRDSLRVVHAAATILAGHYERSRSFGFPLHEAATALLVALGGVTAANMGSLVVTLAGICMAIRLAASIAPDGTSEQRSALSAVMLCGAPLLLVDADSAIDFGWSFAGGMAMLSVALWLYRSGADTALATFGGAITLCILLRPDNILFVASVVIALVWSYAPKSGRIIAVALGAACLAAGVYVGLNGTDMLAGGVASTRPAWARIARAIVLASAVLGPGGIFALAGLARRAPLAPDASFCMRVVWLAWLLYVPRFAALPDQADYLILPVMCTLLLAVAVLPWRAACACAALTVLPAFATVSLLSRDATNGTLRIHIAPQWGALPQDWAARRFAADMARPETAAFVATRLQGPGAPRALTYDTYMPGYVSPAHDLVIGQAHIYSVIPGANDESRLATVPRTLYRDIWACNEQLGPGIGWRGWEPPVSQPPMVALECTKERK